MSSRDDALDGSGGTKEAGPGPSSGGARQRFREERLRRCVGAPERRGQRTARWHLSPGPAGTRV